MFLIVLFCCDSQMQLVSLAQAGEEITQDSLKREGCFSCDAAICISVFVWMSPEFMVILADLSSLDPPVMEGLDELLAVSLQSMALV